MTTSERPFVVRDAGDLRKYRVEIPNMIDDLNLNVYEFRLYVHLKRVAGTEGVCWQSTRTLAQTCRMAVSTVSAAKISLTEKGLIQVEERDREKGESDLITIIDIWPENFARNAEKKADHDLSTPVRVAKGGVRVAKGGVRVAKGGVRVANIRSNPIKNKPIEEKERESNGAAVVAAGAAAPAFSFSEALAEKPAISKKPDPKQHPLIAAFHDLHNRYPSGGQMMIILEADPPIAAWVRAIRAWVAHGHKPTNVAGMLDWAFDASKIPTGPRAGPVGAGRGGGDYAPKRSLGRENRPEDYTDLVRPRPKSNYRPPPEIDPIPYYEGGDADG